MPSRRWPGVLPLRLFMIRPPLPEPVQSEPLLTPQNAVMSVAGHQRKADRRIRIVGGVLGDVDRSPTVDHRRTVPVGGVLEPGRDVQVAIQIRILLVNVVQATRLVHSCDAGAERECHARIGQNQFVCERAVLANRVAKVHASIGIHGVGWAAGIRDVPLHVTVVQCIGIIRIFGIAGVLNAEITSATLVKDARPTRSGALIARARIVNGIRRWSMIIAERVSGRRAVPFVALIVRPRTVERIRGIAVESKTGGTDSPRAITTVRFLR